MRILQVITDPDRRGAQVFATDLGEALARRRHDVTTVALGSGTSPSPLPHEVLGRRRRSPESWRRLRRRLGEHDVAIAHGSTTLTACAVAGIGVRTPWVYRQISESLFWAPDRRRRWQVSTCLRQATLVVTLASSQGDVLSAHFGLDPERIRVVPNGVPASRFPVADDVRRQEARVAFGLEPTGSVLTYVGALATEKGVDLAVDAAAALPGVHLLVAGDGVDRGALERRAAADVPGRVTFAGVLDDVAVAYAAADVVVLPSRGGDSMPAALIEAGLCGRPTVATDVGAIPEIVEDGVTGRIIGSGDGAALVDAVRRLLADPAGLAAMGAAARRRCLDHFEIDVVAAEWESALDEAVAGTGGRRR